MISSKLSAVTTLLASLFVGATSFAQAAPPPRDEPAVETLSRGSAAHGGYGGPETKATFLMGDPAMLVGAQGGWIAGHSLVLGIAGYGLVTRHDTPTAMQVDNEPSVLEMGYGGIRAGYLLQPHRLVHAGFGLLVGAGGLVAHTRRMFHTFDEDGEREFKYRSGNPDAFFVMEPQIEVEANLTSFMRIALSGSYRVITALEVPGVSTADFSAPAAGLALRFGAF